VQTLLQAAGATVVPRETASKWRGSLSCFAPASPLRDNLSEVEDAMIGTLAMTVLIFVSIECPISNRYAPEIRRLHDEFAVRGVRFRLVYPNPLDGDAAVRTHLQEFGYPAIGERDDDHTLVKMAGATITPEAAVFDGQQRLVYRGRIDDRYVELGRERPAATQHDLRNALTALLAGEAVNNARTQAVGCFIADMKPPR
jgi:hypothetical protein